MSIPSAGNKNNLNTDTLNTIPYVIEPLSNLTHVLHPSREPSSETQVLNTRARIWTEVALREGQPPGGDPFRAGGDTSEQGVILQSRGGGGGGGGVALSEQGAEPVYKETEGRECYEMTQHLN